MTAENPVDPLERMAGAISDGQPVDWKAESRTHPELADSIRILKKVSQITAVMSGGSDEHAAWGHLWIVARIGAGSFGDVYRAYDPTLQTDVALKLWKQRQLWGISREEFMDEARRLARVQHVNVLRVYGAAVHDGQAGMWSEFVNGVTLEQLLAAQGPLGAEEAAVIALQLCRALAAIHAAGMVHRDIKTTNVMREQGGRIVLMDFGSSGQVPAQGRLDATFGTTGTPLAMAPERLRGEAALPVSDLYSLGVLVYRLVTGSYPVEAETLEELIDKHASGAAVPLRDRRPDLSRDFVLWVERAIDPDPHKRFPSAGAMEQAASAFVPVRRHGGRRRGLLLVTAVAALAFSVWIVADRFKQRQPVEGSIQVDVPAPTQGAIGALPALPGAALASAELYRVTSTGHERLYAGARVRPGDALFLDIDTSVALYLYVLNEDQKGEVNVLFPTPSFDATNPLPAGLDQRLPGTRRGQPAFWQVSSPGEREFVIVIASTRPQAALEHEISRLRPAELGRPVAYARASDSTLVSVMRGIGGVHVAPVSTPETLPTRLSELIARVADGQSSPESWVWQIDLVNP